MKVYYDNDADVALIQDADEVAQEEGDRIVVTGSRLNVNPNLEAAAPILSVSTDTIKSTGTARIEDLTNQLPQVLAGQAGAVRHR